VFVSAIAFPQHSKDIVVQNLTMISAEELPLHCIEQPNDSLLVSRCFDVSQDRAEHLEEVVPHQLLHVISTGLDVVHVVAELVGLIPQR
jgi:hypothetical protein